MTRIASDHPSIRYFGKWNNGSTGSMYSKVYFTFYGNSVKAYVHTGKNNGMCEIMLDGKYETSVDCFSEAEGETLVFQKNDIPGECTHNLVLILVPGQNEKPDDVQLTISGFEAFRPVDYPAELKRRMNAEYALIRNNIKTWKDGAEWQSIPYRAVMPKHGVIILPGIIRKMYDKNIENIKYNAALPGYCEGEPPPFINGSPYMSSEEKAQPGWSGWLPASNDGRMLAGAAGALRWEEDPELRKIVDSVIGKIKTQMRKDGYFNYYSEESSYVLDHTQDELHHDTEETVQHAVFSERKNYDRVFWTRGMLEAMEAGNRDAPVLLRRMYDWFNTQEQYLTHILLGGNSTNGDPGGPMVYHSYIGKPEDIITNERYYDQDYWMEAFAQKQPMAFSFYPGERPHSTALLPVQAMVDEYSATGAEKYHEAFLGAWDVYTSHYKHTGGPTAICEAGGPYPPDTYYITTGHNGENCGSIYWLWINQRLMQLYPEEEKYVFQIEEVVYNTLMNCLADSGYRYHTRLHGKKDKAENVSSCCQVSATIAISTLPQYIYTANNEGVYINLFISSKYDSDFGRLNMETDFPVSGKVVIKIEPKIQGSRFAISIRIPCWASKETELFINERLAGTAKPGTRIAVNREWKAGDIISFTIPYGFKLVHYTGTDQADNNLPRYTLLYGPVLMALEAKECLDETVIPHIRMTPEKILETLKPDKVPLHFKVTGTGYTYMPYWDVGNEGFTCVPIIC